jgi:hypothetical protein
MEKEKIKKKPIRIKRGSKSNRLTKKQQIFIDEYLKTENGTQSALKAYDVNNKKTAQAIASENLSKPLVIEVIQEKKQSIAERLSDDLLFETHVAGLKATDKVYRANKKGKYEVVYETPDHAVRHKYLDTAYKLKGLMVDKNLNMNVNVESTLEELGNLALQRREERLNKKDDTIPNS